MSALSCKKSEILRLFSVFYVIFSHLTAKIYKFFAHIQPFDFLE